MNDIAKSSSILTPGGIQNLAAAHQRVRSTSGAVGGNYLRLSKGGVWSYGADGVEVEAGSQWAIDPSSFIMGYIAWEEGDGAAKKLGEEMRLATEPPIIMADLPDVHGGSWVEQLGCGMLCLTGEDTGMKVLYNSTSKGGIRAVNDVLGSMITQLQTGSADDIIPVVELDTDSYMHKRYGKIYTPVFKFLRWASMSSSPEAEAQQAPEPEPKPKPEPKPEPEPTPEPTPETPRARRRRVTKGSY